MGWIGGYGPCLVVPLVRIVFTVVQDARCGFRCAVVFDNNKEKGRRENATVCYSCHSGFDHGTGTGSDAWPRQTAALSRTSVLLSMLALTGSDTRAGEYCPCPWPCSCHSSYQPIALAFFSGVRFTSCVCGAR